MFGRAHFMNDVLAQHRRAVTRGYARVSGATPAPALPSAREAVARPPYRPETLARSPGKRSSYPDGMGRCPAWMDANRLGLSDAISH